MPSFKKPVSTISTVEQVDFTEYGLESIPARIDTGARSSAVWASGVTVKAGQLSFKLFGKGSPYYSGRVITTRQFKSVRVKNSFGHSQTRYKTYITIRLNGRTIKAQVTLADRSVNRYPVLIGRSTLRGKFVVDPSLPARRKEVRTLILVPNLSERMEQFAAGLEAQNPSLAVELASFSDLEFDLSGDDIRVTVAGRGKDLASFDLVHFKGIVRKKMDIVAAAGQYLAAREVTLLDRAKLSLPLSSKLCQYVMLKDEGFSTPPSIFLERKRLAENYDRIAEQLGSPFILKDINGAKGRHNYLIKSKRQLAKVLDSEDQTMQFIAQHFIPNDGDFRLLVMGGQIAVINHRRAVKGSHVNNTSQGGSSEMVLPADMPPEVRQDSLKSADLFGLKIAGVDFVKDSQTGVWYCLEVNTDPQIASGAFTEQKLAAYSEFLKQAAKF